MKVLKASVAVNDQSEHGMFALCDATEIEGTIWFVPEWLENPVEQWKMPKRIVSLDDLQFQRTPGSPFGDLVVNEPLSKEILDGTVKPETSSRYKVVDVPNIRISTKKLN